VNQKTLAPILIIIVILGAILYFFYPFSKDAPPVTVAPNPTTITYKNADYGFNFSLPISWQGYSIIKDTWKGNILKGKVAQSGPKLLIRNPKWTNSSPYEDIPILIFTISQWNSYTAEDFSISAAPIQASELARNNKYVFALPPRWNFDYSTGYEEAENIILSKPLVPLTVAETLPAQKEGKIVVSSPLPNSTLSVSPVIIKGKAVGNWFFEASAPVDIVNWDGLIIGQGFVKVDAGYDWMTTVMVPFTGTISYDASQLGPYKYGWIIMKKDNPSGGSQFDDSLEFKILFP
jgi:Immunoglobulin-like domain of bacterial spore germination